MARRRKPEEHANHERWLVSYADFITLLFAFFVVMFSTAQADHGKAARVSESVRKALEDGQVKAVVAAILGAPDANGKGNALTQHPAVPASAPAAPPLPPPDLQVSLRSLETALRPEIEKGELRIRMQKRGLVISLSEAAFFTSGGHTVSAQAYPSIEKIARALRVLPNLVRLEGHTDAVPIHNARFQNNWELSAARSIAVLELLVSQFGVPSVRLAVAGYAETAPVESNDTPEGRAHNRRVDVVILNENGAAPEPSPGQP
ncbi:MAG TPA: flagellar motor protein MotB [Bryobacteraceae bacterium]|nr:flagellar motor protein MotB [Bryobacteraceae bacterium]